MEAAEVVEGEPTRILASERQVTRLGASVFRNGRVSLEAIDLVCSVLAGMAATLKRLEINGIRAVATAAVRDASNQRDFLSRASTALGTEIEIVSGQEEARLIHLGVKSRWPHPKERFLIVDIGGGSAEIILSENERMVQAFSKPLGALRLQELFVRADPPRASEIHRLGEYISERIGSAVRRIGSARIDRVIGTSATASAVICAVNRIPRARREESDRHRATTPQVRRLLKEVSALDLAQRQKVPGIGPRRAEIIIPGASVLLHVLEAFRMPAIFYSAAGVRDGIIADLAARRVERGLSQLSPDQRTVVEQLAEHYGVSLRRARKVARLAADLFHGLQPVHKLAPEDGRLLEAAAYLYDSGHYVSDTRHHKHSYYLVANADLPGFTRIEIELIANLCRYHRKALPTPEHENLQTLNAERRRAIALLNPLLRMADSLDRSRGQRVRSVDCKIRENDFLITVNAPAETDIDLELWAAERLAEIFRQCYGKPTSIARSMIEAPNLRGFSWLRHGFGLRDSVLPDEVITVRQIHSSIVNDAARPAPEGDALISNRPGVAVAVKTADCVPILLADPATHSIAAVHAGWRGTAAEILANTIRQMSEKWGARPVDLHAAIGPGIGSCCYEVGADVALRFAQWVPELTGVETPVRIDLPRINEAQLRNAGVGNIWRSGECTFCAPERFLFLPPRP